MPRFAGEKYWYKKSKKLFNEGEGLEEHRQAWKKRIPFGRMGQPEELTGVIVLLASRAGSYITGADILVDGGLTVF